MRRAVVYAAAIAALWMGGAMGPPSSFAGARLSDSGATEPAHTRERQCRFQWIQDAIWTPLEERLTTECVLDRWSVAGGISKFTAVGQCESGWNRLASNAGRYLGLFQHAASAWVSRVRAYEPRGWDLRQRWQNSRAQIVVTARMVHAGGWGPWACA